MLECVHKTKENFHLQKNGKLEGTVVIRPDSPDVSGVRQRGILHIDMNAFYCACHAALEPQRYRNRPTAVAGNPETRHGILVTCSYEARARGVRATMTVAEALRRCP